MATQTTEERRASQQLSQALTALDSAIAALNKISHADVLKSKYINDESMIQTAMSKAQVARSHVNTLVKLR